MNNAKNANQIASVDNTENNGNVQNVATAANFIAHAAENVAN